MHLDEQLWRQWLEGTLPREEACALAAHLAAGCESCDELLAVLPGDPLDFIRGMEAERAGEAAELGEEALDKAYASVMARVRGAGRGSPAHPKPWHELVAEPPAVVHLAPPERPRRVLRKGLGFAVGAAVTVALSLFLNPGRFLDDLRPATEEGVKGAADAVASDPLREVSISFAVARSGKVVRPGRDADAVPGDADLLFRFRVTGGPAYVYLLRETEAGRRLVWPLPGAPPARMSGEADLAVDGVVQGVSLADVWGEVRFVALASARQLDRMAIRSWPREGPGTASVSVRVERDDQ